MKLLIDTDVFCKLGIAGLLEDTARLFDAQLQECGRLPALPYMLQRGSLSKLYGEAACNALIPVANAIPVVPKPNITWLDRLTAVEAIGPGEAEIFAVAAELGKLFLSGDKRALRALKSIKEFIPVLANRIVALESVLLALCDRLGQEEMRQRVAPLAAVDRMVEVCFSSGNPDPSTALMSYYRALEMELAPLKLWNPRGQG
jgi:hypothetical protein